MPGDDLYAVVELADAQHCKNPRLLSSGTARKAPAPASLAAAAPARLALWDVQRDLCQLQAAGLPAPFVRLGSAALAAVGQPAYAIGHPRGLALTMSAGLVSSLRRNAVGQLVLLQTSAAISGGGSSGGGLFNETGELLSLTTIASVTGDAQNLNFAIPVDWITDLPRRHAATRAAETASAASAASAGAALAPASR